MANVKFFTRGTYFYVADKGGAVTRYEQVRAIADVLINICRSQNVPHGPNDSNRELVDKILESCGGYGGDPNQARVTVKLGKMIDAPIKKYHILRTETGKFYVFHDWDDVPLYYWRPDYTQDRKWVYYLDGGIIKLAADIGVKKYCDLCNKYDNAHPLAEEDKENMSASLQAQYHLYDVFCEIYDFINSRK